MHKLTSIYLHLLYGHNVNVVPATHQQYVSVATHRWAKRSGTADAAHDPLSPLTTVHLDVPSSVALYISCIAILSHAKTS